VFLSVTVNVSVSYSYIKLTRAESINQGR